MPEDYYDKHFPKLKALGFKRTSEPAYYNCIAHIVNDVKRKWWPGEYHPDFVDDYWPTGAPNVETVEAFAEALGTVRFVLCSNGDREEGFEKVALYSLKGKITHGARQMEDGTWRSKLGADEDIEHSLEGLEGPFYGTVVAFLKRTIETTE